MDMAELEQKLVERLDAAGPLPARVITLDFGGEGVLRIDGRTLPATILRHAGPADCRLQLTLADFVAMAKGRLDPQMAYFTGRLRIEGDLGTAMQFGSLLRA